MRSARSRPWSAPFPWGFGHTEGVTHDYQRHGTTTLFAALNVLDGAVIAQCRPRHRHRGTPSKVRYAVRIKGLSKRAGQRSAESDGW